jgi:hypothetical protein
VNMTYWMVTALSGVNFMLFRPGIDLSPIAVWAGPSRKISNKIDAGQGTSRGVY